MDDFGYDQSGTGNSVNSGESVEQQQTTNINTGQIDHDVNGIPATDVNETDTQTNDEIPKNGTQQEQNVEPTAQTQGNDLVAGTSIEVGNDVYTVDDNGNLLDKNGNIFKEAKDVKTWLADFDDVTEKSNNEISIDSIKDSIGIEITDENNNPVQFDNTPDGIRAYVDAVIENSKRDNYETAINTLYSKYPILNDVLNYYIANGNSLRGFGELPDRSRIVVDQNNEAQQEYIIRTAWQEQGRKGDVNGYIAYLKSAGTLYATANDELEGLKESDARYRQQLEEAAQQKEDARIQTMKAYWNDVYETINKRTVAGYQIPESIIVNRNGQKFSVTPNDFFNYIYRVDDEGISMYERDLMNDTPEARRDDEILRAYLKFVGGNYSNLVDMAINKEKVNRLRLKAREKNTPSVRITKPKADVKKDLLDLGYN